MVADEDPNVGAEDEAATLDQDHGKCYNPMSAFEVIGKVVTRLPMAGLFVQNEK